MEAAEVKNYRFICFTDAGRSLMMSLAEALHQREEGSGMEAPGSRRITDLKAWTAEGFKKGNTLIFIGAMGIAVRSIAPFINDKTVDPAVIVMDEKGAFVIPVLSGHIGGAVETAGELARMTGGALAVTTATDVEGLFAVDVFASRHNMYISDMKKAKAFSADILREGSAGYYLDRTLGDFFDPAELSSGLFPVKGMEDGPDLIISPFMIPGGGLQLIPACIVIGIGCKKGTQKDALLDFVRSCLEEEGLSMYAVCAVTSIDIKAGEAGIRELADELSAEFVTFSGRELMEQKGDFSSSEFVRSVTGADNVCERSVMAYGAEKLIIKKTVRNGMSFAAGVKTYEQRHRICGRDRSGEYKGYDGSC